MKVMIHGTILFRCSKCGKLFTAPNIEYIATIYSMPQPCKRCGSIRTYPFSLVSLVGWSFYKNIWKNMEQNNDNV